MSNPKTSYFPSQITRDMAKDTGQAVVLIFLIYLYIGRDIHAVLWPGLLLLLNMAAPRLFTWPARLWFGLSHLLGTVMTKVLLTLLYAIVLMPIALLRKLGGADPMLLARWKKDTDSVFQERGHTFTNKDMETPY